MCSALLRHGRMAGRGPLPSERALTLRDKFASYVHCLNPQRHLSLHPDVDNFMYFSITLAHKQDSDHLIIGETDREGRR